MMSMEQGAWLFGGLLGLFLAILPLLLLARCSHWAFQTQRKLDATNDLLAQLLAEQKTVRDLLADVREGRRGNAGT